MLCHIIIVVTVVILGQTTMQTAPLSSRFYYIQEVNETWDTWNFRNFTPDFTEPGLATNDPDVMRVCGGTLKFAFTWIVQLLIFYPWVMHLLTARITKAFCLPKPSLFSNNSQLNFSGWQHRYILLEPRPVTKSSTLYRLS